MIRAAALFAALLVAAPAYATAQDTRGDEHSFVFIDVKAPEDTIIVIADHYDEAVELYCEAYGTDQKTVEARFEIYDVGMIRNTSKAEGK